MWVGSLIIFCKLDCSVTLSNALPLGLDLSWQYHFFLIWHLNLQLTHLAMCYFDTIFPSLIPGSQWIFQIHLGFFKFKFQISLPVFNSKLTHSSRCWKPRTRKGKKFCYKYKDDLRLLLKGWSEHIKLYPEMFELSSSKAVVEWRYVSDKKIFSNVLIAI